VADGERGRWGRELAADDDLRGTSLPGSEGQEPESVSRPPVDPVCAGGGRIIGDPFDGLDGAASALPGLELDDGALRAPRSTPPARAKNAEAPGPSPLSAAEVAAVADFGPAPSGLLSSIPYAVLVLTRKRALRSALVELRRLAETAARDRDEAMVELGRALHERREGAVSVLARELAAADDAGRVAGERTSEWQRARDVAEAQRTSLTAKIEEAERAAAPHRDRETKLATQMNVRETDLRRAKARLSRVEIELRNLASASPPDVAKRQVLDAERQARAADADAAQSKMDELARELADARRELAVVLSAVNDLAAQRRAVDDAQKRSERLHLSSAGEAERHYHAAVMELAQQALARGIAEEVAPGPTRAALRMQSALDARTREVQLHDAAMDAYEKASFQRGAALLGGAAFLVVVTVLFAILR
jgi:hypothetical protein